MKGMAYPSRKASQHGRDSETKSQLESGLAGSPKVLKKTADSVVGQDPTTQRTVERRTSVNKL